jgi:hypothetical protein
MPLTSRMFKGDPAFEAALVNDHAHITPGSRGNQVWKIQAALMMVMDPPPRIAGNELAAKAKFYGPSTTAAVLEFKRQRKIINFSYEDDVDPIVGKMTVAQLDQELKKKEGDVPSPGYDPDESSRIQTLLDRDRPGVRLLIDTTLDALQKVQEGFDKGATGAGAALLLAHPQAVSGLARVFHVGPQNYKQILPTIIAQYAEYKKLLLMLAGNQSPADFLVLIQAQIQSNRSSSNEVYLEGGQITGKTPLGFSELPSDTPLKPPRKMYFTPRYREFDPANPPAFTGFPQPIRQGQQLHEMGHYHFSFVDSNPRTLPPQECLKSNLSFHWLAVQITFSIVLS